LRDEEIDRRVDEIQRAHAAGQLRFTEALRALLSLIWAVVRHK
jgi:hypothetical protein